MRIIVIDDDQLVCTSLKTILQSDKDIKVIASGTDGTEAVSLYKEHLPDILLIDIQMKNMSGLEAGEIILSEFPDARILYLTTFSDNDYIIKAINMGAKGYLIKQNVESIAPALKAVMSGQSVFGEEIVTKLPGLMNNKTAGCEKRNLSLDKYGVNEREKAVVELVAKGLSNKEIADTLFLSEGTVRNYLSSVLEKLRLRDRTQLAVFYYNN